MPPCNHEEADTKIVIHVINTLLGCTSALVRTVNTDVLVILVGKFGWLIAERSEADVCLWNGKALHFHQRQQGLHFPWREPSRWPSCVSCTYRIWYHLGVHWKGKALRWASLASVQRSYSNTGVSCWEPLTASECWFTASPAERRKKLLERSYFAGITEQGINLNQQR